MEIVLIFGLIILAALYRFPNLNTPMWVDEFSSVAQAKIILDHGWGVLTNWPAILEPHNFTYYALVALAFKLGGVSITMARMPAVLLGCLVPGLVWAVGKKLWNDPRVGLSGALLTVCSYFLIAWSRQSRSYTFQQVILLSLIWCYWQLLSAKTNRGKVISLAGVLGLGLLGAITHTSFLLALAALGLHLALFYRQSFTYVLKHKLLWLVLPILLVVAWQSGTLAQIAGRFQFLATNGLSNNVWYYHSFLWRVHGVMGLLAVFGWLLSCVSEPKKHLLPAVMGGAYLSFFFFLFAPYVTRYLLPIFPLLYLYAAAAIVFLSDQLSDKTLSSVKATVTKKQFALLTRLSWLTPLAITLVIIANGHTFVLKPKAFYSINHEMREIALLDYDQVYQPVLQRITAQPSTPVAMVDTWGDRARWYLGDEYQPLYMVRWENDEGLVNGIERRTVFTLNQAGEKLLTADPRVKVITNLQDLQRVISLYPLGFIWIDDSSLPADIREFAEQNLTKEVYLDHYPLDDNPFSIWPGTLYSWNNL
ncbi:MAG TPA: glycosyltransferase family 39 protein [Vitreimonas sp.]|nr:glycosyltransferase family 39 protein [Vitreimonas sp.]